VIGAAGLDDLPGIPEPLADDRVRLEPRFLQAWGTAKAGVKY